MPPGSRHRVPRHSDHDRHLQRELKQIRPQHAPQSTQRHIEAGEWNQKQNADRQRVAIAHAQRHRHDAGHRLGHPAQDQTVHQQAEIDGAEAAQKRGRLSGITHLGKLHIGQQSGAAPQAGKQKHRHHARQQKRPPQPVPGNALGIDQAGDHQRRVGGKRGRHHRRARQPPGDVAPGHKVIVHALARARAEIESQHQSDAEIQDDCRPVEQGEIHGGNEYTRAGRKAEKNKESAISQAVIAKARPARVASRQPESKDPTLLDPDLRRSDRRASTLLAFAGAGFGRMLARLLHSNRSRPRPAQFFRGQPRPGWRESPRSACRQYNGKSVS